MTNLLRVTAVWGAVVPSFPQSSRRLAGPTRQGASSKAARVMMDRRMGILATGTGT